MISKTFTLGQLADEITGGRLAEMAKLLNDNSGSNLDELNPDPGATVARAALIDLAAVRAGDRVGRKIAQLLGATMP